MGQYTLDRSSANIARLHRDGLWTVYADLPGTFKLQEAVDANDGWTQGTLLKLKHAGLLDNERARGDDAKDWYLTQQAVNWLEDRPGGST